jgi:hypothetical protein
MSNEIFSSCFSLCYKNKEIEEQFIIQTDKNKSDIIRIYTIGVFLIGLVSTITISFYFDYSNILAFQAISKVNYICMFLYLLILLTIEFKKTRLSTKIINWINYISLLFFSVNFRYPLVHFSKADANISFALLCIEMMLRLTWQVFSIQTFIEGFVLNLISISILWAFYVPIGDRNNLLSVMYLTLSYVFALILIICFSYFMYKKEKRAYYFNYMNEKKAKWLQNVFDNMKSGLITIKGREITRVNEYMREKIKGLKVVQDLKESNRNLTEHRKLTKEESIVLFLFLVYLSTEQNEPDIILKFIEFMLHDLSATCKIYSLFSRKL